MLAGVWEHKLTGNIAAKLRQAIHTHTRDEPQRTQSVFGEHRHGLRSTLNIIRKSHPWLTRRATDRPRFDARPENVKYQSEYWKTLFGSEFGTDKPLCPSAVPNQALIETFQLICTPIVSDGQISKITGDLSSKELVQKIKRFNSLVKHYFFGHHTVAFNLRGDTAQFRVQGRCALGIGRNSGLTNIQCKGLGHLLRQREEISGTDRANFG